MDKYIFRERKSLSNETCENLITLFEDSPSKVRNVRNYTMLNLKLSDFSDLYKSLNDSIKKYISKHTFLREGLPPWGWSDYFLLQKYEIGECYAGEHMEHGGSDYDCRRVLGWMIYLNDCDGGTRWPTTKIYNKTKTRRFIHLDSAGWTHSHYGLPSKQEKYILTGWCEMSKN